MHEEAKAEAARLFQEAMRDGGRTVGLGMIDFGTPYKWSADAAKYLGQVRRWARKEPKHEKQIRSLILVPHCGDCAVEATLRVVLQRALAFVFEAEVLGERRVCLYIPLDSSTPYLRVLSALDLLPTGHGLTGERIDAAMEQSGINEFMYIGLEHGQDETQTIIEEVMEALAEITEDH